MTEEGSSENDIKKIKLWNTGFLEGKAPKCGYNKEWIIDQERYILGLSNHYIQTIDANDIYIVQHNLNEYKK